MLQLLFNLSCNHCQIGYNALIQIGIAIAIVNVAVNDKWNIKSSPVVKIVVDRELEIVVGNL